MIGRPCPLPCNPEQKAGWGGWGWGGGGGVVIEGVGGLSGEQLTWQQEQLRVSSETLYHRDDALSTKPVMHYQGTAYLCY